MKKIEKIKITRFVDVVPKDEPYTGDIATGVGLALVMEKLNEVIEKLNQLEEEGK